MALQPFRPNTARLRRCWSLDATAVQAAAGGGVPVPGELRCRAFSWCLLGAAGLVKQVGARRSLLPKILAAEPHNPAANTVATLRSPSPLPCLDRRK
jgi:hypothetical protein